MADVITGNTQLGFSKNDLIVAYVQKELKFSSKLLPFVTDMSVYAGKGMKSVKFPKLTSFTVQNRASGVAGDIQALTGALDTLNLDKNAFISFLIDSSDEIQSSIDAKMENAKRVASSMARYVDEQIIATLEASAFLDIGAAPITTALILDAREQLVKSFANLSDCVLAVGPDQEKAMLQLTEFKDNSVYGGAPVIPSGQIGSVYGMPVLVHQGIATGKAYAWDKNAVAIAFQKAPQMAAQPANQYGVGSELIVMDQLFGVAALQTGELGAGAGLSPLIVKM